jgi:hypothetical protein
MLDPAERVRNAVARWIGLTPADIEIREQAGAHGTLVVAARSAAAAPELSDTDRWFSAHAIYVDGGSGRLFRLPNNAAFLPRAEEFLADPANRARTEIAEDA